MGRRAGARRSGAARRPATRKKMPAGFRVGKPSRPICAHRSAGPWIVCADMPPVGRIAAAGRPGPRCAGVRLHPSRRGRGRERLRWQCPAQPAPARTQGRVARPNASRRAAACAMAMTQPRPATDAPAAARRASRVLCPCPRTSSASPRADGPAICRGSRQGPNRETAGQPAPRRMRPSEATPPRPPLGEASPPLHSPRVAWCSSCRPLSTPPSSRLLRFRRAHPGRPVAGAGRAVVG